MELGRQIKQIRTSKKMTLRDLAASSAVSISQISKIERGNHLPTNNTIIKIALGLNIEPEKLLQIKNDTKEINKLNENFEYTKYKIFNRDNFTCQLCGTRSPIAPLELEYIIPIAYGGKNKVDNLITLCKSCYQGRKYDIQLNGLENDYLYIQKKP